MMTEKGLIPNILYYFVADRDDNEKGACPVLNILNILENLLLHSGLEPSGYHSCF